MCQCQCHRPAPDERQRKTVQCQLSVNWYHWQLVSSGIELIVMVNRDGLNVKPEYETRKSEPWLLTVSANRGRGGGGQVATVSDSGS